MLSDFGDSILFQLGNFVKSKFNTLVIFGGYL